MNFQEVIRHYGSNPGRGARIERHCPATGRIVATFENATATDAANAIRQARQAFDDGVWPRLAGMERGAILRRWADLVAEHAERLARIEADETGKPIRLARGDMAGVVDLIQYASSLAMQLHGETYTNLGPNKAAWIHREPAGVVGMIVPWNFPAVIFAQKVPFALAAGCTVVVKPSEFTSGTAIELAHLTELAGLPKGVLSVITGYGDPVGEAIVNSPDVDMISFTGSTAIGKHIIANAAGTVKRVAVELGGKSANIVFADAKLDDAVDGSLFGIFFNQGECCCSATRLLLDDSIADVFLEKFVAQTAKLRVGDIHSDESDIGALINERHFLKVCADIDRAQTEGARLLFGGKSDRSSGGFFVEPTVFDNVTPEMGLFRDEVFGPVLSVTRFKTHEEAVALANDTIYGLANTIWTTNFDTAHQIAPRLKSGTVWINTTIDGSPQIPFGGYKASGFGREMGNVGVEEFTNVKSVIAHLGGRTNFFVRSS